MDSSPGAPIPLPGSRCAPKEWVRPLRLSDPNRIRGYVLTGRLGRGGEAVVYRGNSRRTGPVAVKVLRTGGAMAGRSSRCEYEFDIARQVDQRFVMPPVEAGMSGAGAYLVTTYRPEYRSLVGRAPLRPDRIWRLAYSSALAIAAIHAAGVIHCDIKPANLLASRGDVRLIDFGIARVAAAQPPTSDLVHCSRGWSAPEQLSADRLTPAVDVFGWGCVMAYLAAGVTPFASATFDEWALRVRSAEPDLAGLPDGLASLVRLALRRDPARRPSAAYLAAACRSAVGRRPDDSPRPDESRRAESRRAESRRAESRCSGDSRPGDAPRRTGALAVVADGEHPRSILALARRRFIPTPMGM